MEEIIGLLVALAAIIFKVVGKKLEKSAVPGTEDSADSWLEEVVKEIGEEDQQEEASGAVVKPMATPTPAQYPAPASRKPAPRKPANKAVPTPVVTNESPKVREKIDPKKLVVYSEIMKPKYLDEN